MKILLINPPYSTDCCAYDTGPYVHSPVPSFGLGYIASFLISKGYNDLKWLECPIYNLNIKDVVDEVKKNNYNFIGITSTSHTYPNALELAKEIKKVSPDSFIVFGGVHVSFDYNNTLKNDFVDAVAIGEGEITTYELIKAIEKKQDLSAVKGIAYRQKGKIIVNESRPQLENLDELPFPARNLLPKNILKKSGASLLTSRGCPFNCIFCSSGKFWNRRVRYRSSQNVIKELKEVIKYCDPKQFEFVDDTFTLDKKRTMEICDMIKKENIKLSWSCNSRVDTIDEEMAKKLKWAGCKEIFFGVESVSQEVLNNSKKGITLEQIKNAIKFCKKQGLYVTLSFVLGLPGESKKTIKDLIEFIKKTEADEILVNPLIPLIGTELYTSPEKYNIKFEKGNWKDYVVFIVDTPQLSKEELKESYMDIIAAILLKEKK